jgi:GNAT superfamily N-acetyltransferase
LEQRISPFAGDDEAPSKASSAVSAAPCSESGAMPVAAVEAMSQTPLVPAVRQISDPSPDLRRRSTPALSVLPWPKEMVMSEVRRFGPADAAAYRALRLDALARHPSAFRAHYDEEAGQDLAAFAARLEADAIFGAFSEGTLCGLAGLAVPRSRNKSHKGVLSGVYVCPDQRRAGHGAALVGAVIEHARGRVEQLHAAVVTTAAPARALYRRLGFEPYGVEPRALKVGDQYFDQELLVLRF